MQQIVLLVTNKHSIPRTVKVLGGDNVLQDDENICVQHLNPDLYMSLQDELAFDKDEHIMVELAQLTFVSKTDGLLYLGMNHLMFTNGSYSKMCRFVSDPYQVTDRSSLTVINERLDKNSKIELHIDGNRCVCLIFSYQPRTVILPYKR